MRSNINVEIALTHIFTRKRQTLVAALGVTMGIAMYIFSNSLMKGFGRFSRTEIFKVTPHLRIYKDDEISKPLVQATSPRQVVIIHNPKITTLSRTIINPYALLAEVKKQDYISSAAPQVNVDVFYQNGKSQLKGVANGVNIAEADAMFNIQKTMVAGSLNPLSNSLSSVVVGSRIANKLNLGLNDNLTIVSSAGVVKIMKIVGIFSTKNKVTDESKVYLHIAAAQQLVKEGPTYITDIYANIKNPDEALAYSQQLQPITTYKVEDWKTSYADILAGDLIRQIMSTSVSMAILLVAAFGIYNILNMTITQKLDDIAILKATGFAGRDIIRIFVLEALIMGIIGTALGLIIGAICIQVLSGVYVGGPADYFPIYFDPSVFITSTVFGLLITIGAGYLPAYRAARVDPVAIFRK